MFGSTTNSSGHSSGNPFSPTLFGVAANIASPFGMSNSSGTTSGVVHASSAPAFGGSTTGFASGHSSGNPLAPEPFGMATNIASPFGMSNSSGTTSGVVGATVSPFPSTKTVFGASSAPAFGGSTTGFGFTPAPAPGLGFGFYASENSSGNPFALKPFGVAANIASPFGMSNSSGTTSGVVGTTFSPFPNTKTVFDTSSAPRFKPSTFNGSPEILGSISAMPLYKDKSHEELRSEDYQLFGDKGGFVSQNSHTKSNAFNGSSNPPISGSPFSSWNPAFTSSLLTGSFNAPTSRNSFYSIAPRTASGFPLFSSSSFTNSLTSSSCTTSTSVTLPASPFGPTNSFSLFQPSSSPSLSVNPVSSATSVIHFPLYTPPISGSLFANSPSTTSIFAPSITVTVSEPSLFASSPSISTSISPSVISPGLSFTINQPSLLLPRAHSPQNNIGSVAVTEAGGQNKIAQGSDSQTTAAGQPSSGVTSGDCDYYLLYDPPQSTVERNKCLRFCLVLSCVFNLLFILIITGKIY